MDKSLFTYFELLTLIQYAFFVLFFSVRVKVDVCLSESNRVEWSRCLWWCMDWSPRDMADYKNQNIVPTIAIMQSVYVHCTNVHWTHNERSMCAMNAANTHHNSDKYHTFAALNTWKMVFFSIGTSHPFNSFARTHTNCPLSLSLLLLFNVVYSNAHRNINFLQMRTLYLFSFAFSLMKREHRKNSHLFESFVWQGGSLISHRNEDRMVQAHL